MIEPRERYDAKKDYMILPPGRVAVISGEGPIVHSEFRSLAREAQEARGLLARALGAFDTLGELYDNKPQKLEADIKKFLRGRQ